MPPGAFTSAGHQRHRLVEDRSCRSTGCSLMLRINWNVQPVSSYGRRVLRRVVLHREVHVGQRAERLVAADDVVAGLDVDVAGLERARRARCTSRPWRRSSLTASAASALRRCVAGITHAYVGPFLPLSTARLFFSQ